jgi:hypothetical protein
VPGTDLNEGLAIAKTRSLLFDRTKESRLVTHPALSIVIRRVHV